MRELTRTSVQRTQGTLISQSFNSTTSSFNATFKLDTQIKAPSVIYMNQDYHSADLIVANLDQSQYKIEYLEGGDLIELHIIDSNLDKALIKVQATTASISKSLEEN